MDVANCRPGDQADLVKLAKQVEALTQKAKDSDKGKGNNHDSHDSHEGNGKSSGKNPDNNAGKNGGNHGDSDSGRGHDKSGCWHAS
jgi:hypothetical protein